jgi:hypothetical protein
MLLPEREGKAVSTCVGKNIFPKVGQMVAMVVAADT